MVRAATVGDHPRFIEMMASIVRRHTASRLIAWRHAGLDGTAYRGRSAVVSAGLSAAYRLHELAAARQRPIEIAVFEAGDRLGGALETIRRDGFVIETGADSFLSEKPWALQLAERLGLTDEWSRTQQQFRKTLRRPQRAAG